MTLLITYLLIALLVSFLCSILEAVLLSSTPSYIESLGKKDNSDTAEMLRNLKSNIHKTVDLLNLYGINKKEIEEFVNKKLNL